MFGLNVKPLFAVQLQFLEVYLYNSRPMYITDQSFNEGVLVGYSCPNICCVPISIVYSIWFPVLKDANAAS